MKLQMPLFYQLMEKEFEYAAVQSDKYKIVGVIQRIVCVTCIVSGSVMYFSDMKSYLSIFLLGLVCFLGWLLSRAGYQTGSSLLLIASLLIAVQYNIFQGYGMHDVAIIAWPALIFFSGLLFGSRVIPYSTALIIFLAVLTKIIPNAKNFTGYADTGDLIVMLLILIAFNFVGMSIIHSSERSVSALRESESRFRAFVEQAPVAIGVFNLNGNGMYANQKFIETLELPSIEDMIGRPAFEYFAPQFREESKERTRRRLHGLPVPDEYESIALHSDGSEFPVQLAVAPIQLLDETASIAFLKDITEQKRLEEAYKQSEAKYRRMVETANEGVIVLDRDQRMTLVNQQAASMLGYTNEELLGQKLESLMFEDDLEDHQEQMQLRAQGQSAVYERCFRHKNGGRLWTIVSATAITDAEGRFDGAFGMITDITDRKQAEEALRDGEERYHSLFDQSIVVVSAKDGKWIQISPLFCDMLGYSMEELMGMIFTQITHPDDLAANLEQIKRIVKGEIDNFILEKRYLHKNGDVVWANISVTSIRDTFGALVQTVAVIQNITERKQYEMALVESQTMTKAIVDSTSDMIWSVDPDNYGLQTFNHGLRDYFLHKRGISIQKGMRPEDLFPTEDFVKLWREFYQRALKEGPYSMDYIAYTGSVMMQLTFNLLKCDGKVFGISVFGKDITERRRAEEEKEKLSEQLFQAQKMESIGRLAGGVAHDFNNMLGVIMGHSEMAIAKTSPNQSIYPDLQEILKATQSSADLTRQLLAFARKQIAIPKILDLNDTVGNMLKMLRRLIGENIDLVWHPGDDLWNVKVDPTHIDQILANLLVNARDAIAGDGKITIETTNIGFDEADCAQYAELTPGKYVLLSVSDNGSGMNHETLSHIFEPFYTTKDVGKGTGLGLATVYGIVKQNNGYINVYSEPGQGTTFKIYLPRSESKAIPITVSEKEENTPRGMETVLMVEDEESLLELGKDTLEAQGYTVLVASTPEKALNIIQEHASGDVHLLITDVVMPGMNGRKLAEHVKAICPDMKCLFMSGYTSDIIADQGVLDEDVYFIQKPFPLNDLAVKVHQVLTQ